MIKYLVAEISGKQYKIEPNKLVWTDYLGKIQEIECEKILLKAEDDKITVGNPYLREKIVLVVEPNTRKEKIRVSTYKPKANTRVVKGVKVLRSGVKLKLNSEKS